MKNVHVLVLSICAFALVFAVGCSSAPASSSSSSAASSGGSASASSTSASALSASSASASSAASSSSSAANLTEETAIAQGYQVFKGTVRVSTVEELIALQAIDIDPAIVGNGGTYAVLVFDQPTDVTGESADGSGQRTEQAKMLGIAEFTDYESFVIEYGDLDKCKQLDGQQATIAAKAENIMFPSDVRLPINEPSANESIILS